MTDKRRLDILTLHKYMQLALQQAKLSDIEIPVGAVIECDGEVIAKSCNLREKTNDVSAHAEIIALREASKKINNWRLGNCNLYVTLEPCPMCGWAILQSRVKNIYFGSYDYNYGAFSAADLVKFSPYKPNIYGGIMEDECNKILQNYFNKVRNKS